ncbi:type VI secretion system secreted protein VgrG [Paraburkholderia bannensis]|uniref:Type VI secretion system secreted protein VgrG n=1 Tax=Paraburkholderia bannensis TaxID=765414 RepID=A0A7W9TXT9_9BURK|nr:MULTISPECIES: type VI secretion system tip protein TssI/VgrG [Paraburkholderia]MBB3258389.1 type VI secretion system secreted protein VgrG [Paraburkholderia sp. WP4_3_2]MBB6103402.1 type VI secretion system secreted protein VgrG [Paraburkholderia bannensis]
MDRPPLTDTDTRIELGGSAFTGLFAAQVTVDERIGAPAEISVRALGAMAPPAPGGMPGQHATLKFAWGENARLVDAVCTRAAQLPSTVDASHFALTLRSWLWLLTLAQNNRIFQNKTAAQIIEAVFAGHSMTEYTLSLTGTPVAREWCVQYGESDFAFVSRLCEEEGWFYFFRHQDGVHTLVIADNNDAFATLPGAATLSCAPLAGHAGSWRESGQILYCEIVEQTAAGTFSHGDYAWQTPAAQLYSQAQSVQSDFAVYEYPGRFATSDVASTLAKQRVDALRASTRLLTGESDCRALTPGYRFTLSGHESSDANIEWVVASVVHEADHTSYRNRFEAFPASVNYRAPRTTRRPFMPTQTATVVGKSGEELWTDQYGRVKVQFHWDREGKLDEQSSCWIRVAQPWASKGFGMQFMPRIGDEVVVSFIDGDADRPLITSSVYNGANLPPYALPDNQTQSGLKSSSSPGGAGFNELRFEDKKDNEEVFLQAQKNFYVNVLNDASATIGHDETRTVKHARSHTIQESDDTLTIEKGNRSMTVQTGGETIDVKGTRTVKAGGDETRTVGGALKQTVTGDMTLTIDGNLTIKVGGSLSIQSTGSYAAKSDASMTHQAAMSLTNEAGTALTNKSSGTLSNEAQSLTNKGSVEQTVDGGAMLTVKGGIVKLN